MAPPQTLLAGCLAAALAAGCGGGARTQSDEERVAGTVTSFLHALSAGDGERACSLLTAEGQRKVVGVVARRAPTVGAPATCADAVGLVRIAVPQAALAAIRDARVDRIAVRGGTATGRVVDGAAFPAQRVTLSRSGDQWRIAGVPSLIGG